MAFLLEKLKDIFILSRSELKEDHINLQPSKILEAAEMGHIKDVKNLLQRVIDVNFTSQSGLQLTSLHYASKNNHIEIVELLLQSGAAINTTALCFYLWTSGSCEKTSGKSCKIADSKRR